MGNSESFGYWLLHEIETVRGWRRSDFARRVGVSTATVTRWVNGEDLPTPENCRRIARALGVDPDVVLTAAGYEPEQFTRERTIRGAVLAAREAFGRFPGVTAADREAYERFTEEVMRRLLAERAEREN